MVLAMAGFAQADSESSHDDGHHQGDGHWSGYQRHAFDRGERDDRRGRRDFGRGYGYPMMAPVSAGWFQRPYPYHLDYYRMRYGGSYAPYFGNLYGPPQVVTAPPYYGPYYGGYGGENANGYGNGFNGAGMYPTNLNVMGPESAIEQPSPAEPSATKPKSEGLPAPAP